MILTQEQIEDLKKGLTSYSDLQETIKRRKSIYEEEKSVKHKFVAEYIEDGWVKTNSKKSKLTQRMGLPKPKENLFEDKVWTLFALMGYNRMNKDRHWSLPFGKKAGEAKQIDVFAVNDETLVIVECKYTDAKGKNSDFKKELESYQQIIGGLINATKELFPEKTFKCKFILATENYKISSTDKNRIESLHGLHLSEENIEYFYNLFDNIGEAAKYQFAGYIFDGNSIPELPNKVPAIKAKMGGLTYYSFSIEPETLLKISYVPHRNRANRDGMDTYQRLVKGSRLKSITKFITEDKGFFPNSIIVNVVSDKPLQFDLAGKTDCNTNAKIGILHLPAAYKSALVIDGQHRLLAYAGTDYASTHTIPVVAFENLDADQQIKLFMQINQNQKPVEKNLRNTLNSIILDDSKILADRIRGMRLRIAEDIATDNNSSLKGCVGAGVDEGKITSTALDNALNMDIFLGKIKKNEIIKQGVFFKGDEKKAYENYKKFIFKVIDLLVENVSEVQQPGDDGYILTNRGIYGYLRCIGDILIKLSKDNETLSKVDGIIDMVKPYLEPLFTFFNTKIKDKDEETITSLKTQYGGGGDARYYRTFERVIKEVKSDFNPEGLEAYWDKFSKERVNDAQKALSELEEFLRNDIVEDLKDKYSTAWFDKGIPLSTKKGINNKVIEFNDRNPDHPANQESMIGFEEFIEIILNNWSLFKDDYTERGITGDSRDKISWIARLAQVKKDLELKPFIDKDSFDYIMNKKNLYMED